MGLLYWIGSGAAVGWLRGREVWRRNEFGLPTHSQSTRMNGAPNVTWGTRQSIVLRHLVFHLSKSAAQATVRLSYGKARRDHSVHRAVRFSNVDGRGLQVRSQQEQSDMPARRPVSPTFQPR